MITELKNILTKIENKTYLTDSHDNELLLKYVEAKRTGTYGSLDYGIGGNGCADKTLLKDVVLIRQAINNLNKPFHKINRDDIIKYRNDLKTNEIKAIKYKKDENNNSVSYESLLAYRSKRSILSSLRQFWAFYQEYNYKEFKKDIPNIFERITLRKPKETEHKIDYLNSEQIKKLMILLSEKEDLKLLCAIAIDQAPRPIELVNLKRKHFFYENNKLWCRLPSIKGCSGRKHINQVCFEKSFIERKINDLDPEKFLFNFIDDSKPFLDSPGCFNWSKKGYLKFLYTVRYYTNKIIGRKLSPYMFRKSSIMYWLKITNNDVLSVQKRAGHVEGSNQIKHYMTFQGLETPVDVLNNIKMDKYETVGETMMAYEEEATSNKLKMEQMQRQMDIMQKQFMNMVAQIPMINAVEHKDIIEQTIQAIQNKNKITSKT